MCSIATTSHIESNGEEITMDPTTFINQVISALTPIMLYL